MKRDAMSSFRKHDLLHLHLHDALRVNHLFIVFPSVVTHFPKSDYQIRINGRFVSINCKHDQDIPL